ncbi:MAG TPA: response regulator [Ferruginibacter sp.]|nr:response regulator [Ferruginibacter sp.]
MKNSPIVIVEDDEDDCEMLVNVFREIGVANEFRCFLHPVKAIEYLKTTKEIPFLIISDINMPYMDGFAFKKVIDLDTTISNKRIPFVFLSTAKENNLIDESFHLSIQGYFQKPNDLESLKEIAHAIVVYWKHGAFKHKLPFARA